MSASAPISPWMESLPPAAPALADDLDVDVAVVGAGYTGLSTAIALREAGLSVAILERDIAGFGASGRNAGHVTPTIGKDLPSLLRFMGRTRTERLLHLMEDAIAHLEATIARHRIDCAYRPTGNVVAAVHPRQQRRIERAARVAEELGVQVRYLGPTAMRDRGLPRAFVCGYLEEAGGTLHPGRYVQGLRRVALDAGAQLFEHTPVEAIDADRRIILRAPRARVRAEQVVLATNAYTPQLGWLRSAIVPLAVSLFRTGPISRAQREALNWDGCEGIYTAHEILESFRLTEDDRIVGGSKTVRFGFGHRLPPLDDPPTFACIEAMFRERFPELAALPVQDVWSGYIALTLDFLPAFGCTGRHRNVYYGIGYAGHGVAMGSYAGRILTDMIRGRATPADVLMDRFRPPVPPEPLRWLVSKGLVAGLSALDRRLDRAVRHG